MAKRTIPKPYLICAAWLASEGLKAAEILRELQKLAKEARWTEPLPSERTLRSVYNRVHGQDAAARREHALFKWPHAMEAQRALPWSASRAALDLVRFRDEQAASPPTIREAKWFARLKQAAPDMPVVAASTWAAALALNEVSRLTGLSEPVGDYELQLDLALVYQPWRSDEDKRAYEAAAARSNTRTWSGWPALSVEIPPDKTADEERVLLKTLFGINVDVEKQRERRRQVEELLSALPEQQGRVDLAGAPAESEE